MAFYAFHRGYDNELRYKVGLDTELAIIDTEDLSIEYYSLRVLKENNIEVCNLDNEGYLNYEDNFPQPRKLNYEIYINERLTANIMITKPRKAIFTMEFLETDLSAAPTIFVFNEQQHIYEMVAYSCSLSCIFQYKTTYVIRYRVKLFKNSIRTTALYVFIDINLHEIRFASKPRVKLSSILPDGKIDCVDRFTYKEDLDKTVWRYKYFSLDATGFTSSPAINLETGFVESSNINIGDCVNRQRTGVYGSFKGMVHYPPFFKSTKTATLVNFAGIKMRYSGVCDAIIEINGKKHTLRSDVSAQTIGTPWDYRLDMDGELIAYYTGIFFICFAYREGDLIVMPCFADKLALYFNTDGDFLGVVGGTKEAEVVKRESFRKELARAYLLYPPYRTQS